MAVFYTEGETKKRPGPYQRHTNTGYNTLVGARDGVCAIPVQSNWGPLGKVLKNTKSSELESNYGPGTYGDNYTVPAAAAMFEGGASVVYTYRLGTGGKEASIEVAEGMTATAKYPGDIELSIAVQEKLGDNTKKQLLVYVGKTLVETWDFAADSKQGANLVAATAKSNYIVVAGDSADVPVKAVAEGKLTGGSNPTVTNESYSAAFAAFEPFAYNTIALDKDDDEAMTLSLLLQTYMGEAYKLGKLCIAVVGQKTSVPFADRCSKAKSFNDCKVVYLGGGYMAGTESKDGVMAICYTAGLIASTPSNRGITHTVINGATDLCEHLTYAKYEQAIESGMLVLSVSQDGTVWYDSGINTLVTPEEGTQDEGWKKIRRVKTRFELIDRLDRALMPKIGRVTADSDGIADIVQTGQRILDAMANNEGKLKPGATFTEDPANPVTGDSAWFIIQADDNDSLEKIYMQYQFRYSQKS